MINNENSSKSIENLTLQFTIDQKTAFELIEGSSIYGHKLIFIRELLQNAMDATKLQIWRDIKKGKYDNVTEFNCGNRILSKEDLKFYDEIPREIIDLYPIGINIFLDENSTVEDEYIFIFTIEDCGCGITIDDLKRMGNVGESWLQDKELTSFIEDMPFFLQPTGNFGLGLHSVFMVTDDIDMETKSETEDAYNINFESRRKSGYITIKENTLKRNRGTKIIVKVKESKLDFFEEDKKFHYPVDMYDFLDPKFKVNQFLNIFRGLASHFMRGINMLSINCIVDKIVLDKNFYLEGEELNKHQLFNTNDVLDTIKPLVKDYGKDNLSCKIYFDTNYHIKGYIKDKFLGATIEVTFGIPALNLSLLDSGEEFLTYTHWKSSSCSISYKEMSCCRSIQVHYLDIRLDLFKDRAKDILDVSRSEIKEPIVKNIAKRLNEILIPRFLDCTKDFLYNPSVKNFINENKINITIKKSLILFNLARHAYLNTNNIEPNYFNTYAIMQALRKKDLNTKILVPGTLNDFLSATTIYLPYYGFNSDYFDYITDDDIESSIVILKEDNCGLYSSFDNFTLDKAYMINSDSEYKDSIIKLQRKTSDKLVPYSMTIHKGCNLQYDFFLQMLEKKHPNFRMLTPAIKYSETNAPFECLVINYGPSHLYSLDFSNYIAQSIVSPISHPIPEYLKYNSKDLIAWIKANCRFTELIDWVYENSVIQPNDKKTIEEAYITFIEDFVHVMKLNKTQ